MRFTRHRSATLVLAITAALATLVVAATAMAAGTQTYTLDADFDQGTLVGVEHDTVHDQLQLAVTPSTLPFIWVPNNDGTVSKLHTESGDELGRYYVAPFNGNPSRTTVDLEGACYVGTVRRVRS